MNDVSFSDHHWEDLHKDPGSKAGLDHSFHSVHTNSEHPEDSTKNKDKKGRPQDLPEELYMIKEPVSPIKPTEDNSVSGTISTATATSRSGLNSKTTTYDDVLYHDEPGTLILNSHRITFQPHGDNSESGEESHNHQSWRWKAIRKHQVTPAKSGKIMMKLVSLGDAHKSVTFTFHSREELDRARKDVSRRLRHSRDQDNSSSNSDFETPAKTLKADAISPDTALTMDTSQEEAQKDGNVIIPGDSPKGEEFAYLDDNDGKKNLCNCEGCIIL